MYDNYTEEKKTRIIKEFAHVINCNSLENGSDTPDFMLAEYLYDCLVAFNKTSQKREEWYGRQFETINTELAAALDETSPLEISDELNTCPKRLTYNNDYTY